MLQRLILPTLSACAGLMLLAGCSTPQQAKPKTYTFFPPAPDDPRIQFLTSFNSDSGFQRKRTFADFIIGERNPSPPIIKPYGVAVHGGKIYVCDTVSYVIHVFDLKRKYADVFRPAGEGKMALPVNVTVDADGTLYVSDTGRCQVLVYNADGTFREAMGRKDEMKPTDVALTADRVYVADLLNHCVRVYGKADRKLLFTVPADPKDEKAAQGRLHSPVNLTVDTKLNCLLVSDIGGSMIQMYDLDGKYVRTIGRQGVAPGMFARPKGIAVSREGHIYVVDAATQVVQIFDMAGRLLLFFGAPGATLQGELILPAAVAIDYDNVDYFKKYVAPGRECEYLIYVTSQAGGQKVSVYGFLKQKK